MQPTTVPVTHPRSAPRFTVIERQPLRPAAVMLAIVIAASALGVIGFGLAHSHASRMRDTGSAALRQPEQGSKADPDDDDPSQVDVIALGDAADAPVPAHRQGRAGSVHPTILVHLPRFGEQTGLIPDTASGHLLYGWLAAFNRANPEMMAGLLTNAATSPSVEAQMQLRRLTGGFNLLSARQVAAGVLVFRLRDQTPLGTEALGTLQVDTTTNPPSIVSLSLRAVPNAGTSTASTPTAPAASTR